MTSLRAVLEDYVKYNFPLERIIEKYKDWVSEDTYMILSKWNQAKWKNDVYAVSVLNVEMTFIIAELKVDSRG